MEPFDTTRPNIARVWDYWLGGKENFAADRELAEKMLAVHPVSAQMARENRQFLGRAVSYVAARGVRQFIDVGAGLPTALNTHDIARRVDPEARVAYVDNDPVVISHARSLLAKSPGVIAVPGDMRDPGRILADAGLAELIDLAEPACVILSGVLHFADAGTARGVAAAFARRDRPRQLPDHLRRFRQPVRGRQLHLGVHRRADIHPLAGGDPQFLRRPGTRASRRGPGAVLVRRRPGTEPEAAHGDLPRRRSPQAVRRLGRSGSGGTPWTAWEGFEPLRLACIQILADGVRRAPGDTVCPVDHDHL